MSFDPKNHKRVNDILLGPLERPALAWLARHMPSWVTPDLLTGTGLFAAILIFASYWLTNYNHNFLWLASFGFLLNWFGDSLDGTLARYRRIERPHYGFFIDHVIDVVAETFIFLGIGLSPYVDFQIASLALVAYFMVSILAFLMALVNGVFRISDSKFGPTEIRAIAILTNTIIYFFGNPSIQLPFGNFLLFNVIVGLVIFLLLYLFVTNAIQEARAQAKIDGLIKKTERTEARREKENRMIAQKKRGNKRHKENKGLVFAKKPHQS